MKAAIRVAGNYVRPIIVFLLIVRAVRLILIIVIGVFAFARSWLTLVLDYKMLNICQSSAFWWVKLSLTHSRLSLFYTLEIYLCLKVAKNP